MKSASIITSFIFVACLPSLLFASNLKLKSGQEVEGPLIEQTESYIKIDFMGVPLTYFMEDIDTIDGVPVVISVKKEPAQAASPQEEPKQVVEKEPQSAEDYFYLGVSSVKKGNLEEAFADFTKAIELNPEISEAYYNRAKLAKMKGDLEGALSDFSKAIGINPKYKEAYNNRATVYFAKKEFEAALQDLRKAEELGYSVNPEFLEKVQKALKEKNK